MKLKLKETIRVLGARHLPGAVVDTGDAGISDAEAQVLVRRGTADVIEPEPPQEPPATGTLAGVVEESGAVVPLADMTKADLVELAVGMGLDATGKTKAQLVELIGAQQVQG